MNDTNPTPPDVFELVHAFVTASLEGTLTDKEVDDFEQLLCGNAEARHLYAQYIEITIHVPDMLIALETGGGQAGLARLPALPAKGNRDVPGNTVLGLLSGLGQEGWGFLSDHLLLFSVLVAIIVAGSVAVWKWESRTWNSQGRFAVKPSPRPDLQPATRDPKSDSLPVARLTRMDDCQWTGPTATLAAGQELTVGQQIDILSGQVEIAFDCEAVVVLYGPSVLQVKSGHEARLVVGHAKARAETARGHGFMISTRTASVVDLGTEFHLQAAADGHSAVYVTSGAVEVRAGGSATSHRLEAGQTAQIEPGSAGIIAIIESGDNTAAFKFPTIEPPSKTDFADASQHHAAIRVVEGELKWNSGPVDVLLNGHGQSKPDSPTESVFFREGQKGKIVVDLGRGVRIRKVNTYSWHIYANAYRFANPRVADEKSRGRARRNARAPQRYTLYGFMGDHAPPTAGDPAANGWKMICRVSTDDFFSVPPMENRPAAQQAVSIQGTDGSVGRYRYLLWHVFPTRVERDYFGEPADQNTFFGEFDVYAE